MIHYDDGTVTIHHGDCIEVMRTLPDASIDAVVTDPPYGLEFMGKDWDKFRYSNTGPQHTDFKNLGALPTFTGGEGGASRFFYTSKAGRDERPTADGVAHPTVKPLDLMRWLVRLVTPPGGVVLDPFAGSGTTAEACIVEGFRCIAIELTDDYLPLIVARLSKPIQPTLGAM